MTEEEIEQLTEALHRASEEAKLKVVLALPDDATAATSLLEEALPEADPRLKVALLDALFRLNRDPQVEQQLIAVLDSPEAMGDAGEELYMMARIALNRTQDDDGDAVQAEGEEIQVLGAPREGAPDELALVIHGTWAQGGTWWRPGGDFHTYLRTECGVGHLYDGHEPFVWSGRNRGSARRSAARALGEWVARSGARALEVYAHSHGANVAMLSTRLGLPIRKLVMLSPPVRGDYFARWEKVEAAYNIQASFDPVVGIARGGRWFGLPQVRELELRESGHSSSHVPAVWEGNGVPAFVGLR